MHRELEYCTVEGRGYSWMSQRIKGREDGSVTDKVVV